MHRRFHLCRPFRRKALAAGDRRRKAQSPVRQTAYRQFLDQLATLLTGGVPILEALESLSRSPHGKIAGIASELGRRIRNGAALGDAMAQLRGTFPPAHAALVGAAEQAGATPRILVRLRDEVDRRLEAQRALLGRAAYPIALLALAAILSPIYLVVQGKVGTYLLLQISIFGGAGVLAAVLFKFRRNLESLLPALPFLGCLFRRKMLGESLSLLGLLVGGGIGIREALLITAGTTRSPDLSADLKRSARALDAGQNLAGALSSIPGLPPEEQGMIASGERAGAMDRTLESAGRSLEESAQRAIKRLLWALAILIYLTAALIVAILYIQTILGLYSGI